MIFFFFFEKQHFKIGRIFIESIYWFVCFETSPTNHVQVYVQCLSEFYFLSTVEINTFVCHVVLRDLGTILNSNTEINPGSSEIDWIFYLNSIRLFSLREIRFSFEVSFITKICMSSWFKKISSVDSRLLVLTMVPTTKERRISKFVAKNTKFQCLTA